MAFDYINPDNPVYFTYSRNSSENAEWKHIADVVDDLLKSFRQEGVKYSVDKEDIQNGDRISAYEREIADANYVIIVLSDRYFYRYHCMFELCNILKNTQGKTIKYIKSGNFDIKDREYRRKIKEFWLKEKAVIEYKIATYKNPDISLLEQSAIDHGYYLDFIDQLSNLISDVSYENADNIRLGLLGSNPRHTQFINEIKRNLGWRPPAESPKPAAKFNEKYVLYATLAVMFGIIIWLVNRTPESKNAPPPVLDDTITTIVSDISIDKKDTQKQQPPVDEKKDTQKQEPPVEEKKDSHEYVDLGLPSGTLWATCNVGANNPWEYGDYFAWGEIEPYYSSGGNTYKPVWKSGKSKGYDWPSYKYANGAYNKLTKYCNKSDYGNNGYTDSRTVLEKADDVAYQKWGSDWSMPTPAQFQELKDKCKWTWTTKNGNKGYEVKGPNGNTIFLPAAGYRLGTSLYFVGSHGDYWSSSLNTDSQLNGRFLWFVSSRVSPVNWNGRYCGLSVRPVRCR